MLVWMGFNMWSRPADILWDTATKHIDFINNHLTHTEKSVWQGLFMGREQKSQDFAPNCPFCALFPTSCLPSTNSFLCFYATSFYQTPSLSHLFQLSWDACLSPRFFLLCSFPPLLFSSPLLLLVLSSPGVFCHLLCSLWYDSEQTTQRQDCNMKGVKMSVDTRWSRTLH